MSSAAGHVVGATDVWERKQEGDGRGTREAHGEEEVEEHGKEVIEARTEPKGHCSPMGARRRAPRRKLRRGGSRVKDDDKGKTLERVTCAKMM